MPPGGYKGGGPLLLPPALWEMGGREGIPFTWGVNPSSIETRGAPGASLPLPHSSVETPLCGGTKGVPSAGQPLSADNPRGPPLAPQPRGTVTCGVACTARWVTPGWLGVWLEGTGVGDAALALPGGRTGGGEWGHPNSARPGSEHLPTGVLRGVSARGGDAGGAVTWVSHGVTIPHPPPPGTREDGGWGR